MNRVSMHASVDETGEWSNPIAEDREVRAVHAAEVATATFIKGYDLRWMIPFRIVGGGQSQNLGRAELHAETATLAVLDNNRYTTLSHQSQFPYLYEV